MTRIFGIFERIIKSHGGAVEKYIGDALVAVFGVPELHEDDPSRAIHAALEFLSSVKEENKRLTSRSLALSFRTGINTGLITTGRRGEFDVVTGHAMNVAQRLEAAALRTPSSSPSRPRKNARKTSNSAPWSKSTPRARPSSFGPSPS